MNGAAGIGCGIKLNKNRTLQLFKVPSSMVELFVEVLNEMLLSRQK